MKELEREIRLRRKAVHLRRRERKIKVIEERLERQKKEKMNHPRLIDPRLLTKANSYFYNEEERDSKGYTTMTIFLGLKRDYKIPNEKEPDYYKLRRIGTDVNNMTWAKFFDEDLFNDVLAKRVKYLLMSIGFAEEDIPFFQKSEDDFDCFEDFDLLIHQDLVEDYYVMWVEAYRIYHVWKLCDFLYSNRITKKGGMEYITLEEIIDNPFNIAGDNLIFLYAIPGEQC